MDLFFYTVIGLTTTWLMYAGYMYIATRSNEGKSVHCLHKLFPELNGLKGRALVYCFSPNCGPCRPMSKEVDILIADGIPAFKLNIADHPEISRELGIRATPTLALIEDGAVLRMVLGVRSASYMHKLVDQSGG